jgi:hypothetical protein
MGSDVYSVGNAWRVSVREVVRGGAHGRWCKFTVDAVARLDRAYGSFEAAEAALDMVQALHDDVMDEAPASFVRAG